MKMSMRIVLVFICLLQAGSFVFAQDERTYQAFVKQAQRYESEKYYKQALASYRKAQPHATLESRKILEKNIERLDELVQQQQLVNEGLASIIQKKINSLASQSNRNRLHDELEKLQQTDGAKEDYQQLIREVDATKQIEIQTAKTQVAVKVPNTVNPRPASRSPVPPGPPLKIVTTSMPLNTARTAKSAGALLNGSSKPK